MYIRKTVDEWQLLIDYGHGHGFEEVTAENTRRDIKQRQKEYRENCPEYPSKIKCVRIPKPKCSNCNKLLSDRESTDALNTEASCAKCHELIHGINPYEGE